MTDESFNALARFDTSDRRTAVDVETDPDSGQIRYTFACGHTIIATIAEPAVNAAAFDLDGIGAPDRFVHGSRTRGNS